MLKRYIKDKGIKAISGKRNPSYSIVNTIGGKYLRALKKPNKKIITLLKTGIIGLKD